MVSMKLQKRLAANILNCGEGKLWFDPNESNIISLSISRMEIRELIKDGMILKKPLTTRSRWRWRWKQLQKVKRNGFGKRKGTREARQPSKLLWMRKIRVLRNLLQKYRQGQKIDKHEYHEMYLRAKGNVFRNKRLLIESIHKMKAQHVKGSLVSHQLLVSKKSTSK